MKSPSGALTLLPPILFTTHVNIASRPWAIVTFSSGNKKSGSKPFAETYNSYTIIIDGNGHFVYYYIKSRKVSPQQIEKKIADIVPKCFCATFFPEKSQDIIKLFFFFSFGLSRSTRTAK